MNGIIIGGIFLLLGLVFVAFLDNIQEFLEEEFGISGDVLNKIFGALPVKKYQRDAQEGDLWR